MDKYKNSSCTKLCMHSEKPMLTPSDTIIFNSVDSSLQWSTSSEGVIASKKSCRKNKNTFLINLTRLQDNPSLLTQANFPFSLQSWIKRMEMIRTWAAAYFHSIHFKNEPVAHIARTVQCKAGFGTRFEQLTGCKAKMICNFILRNSCLLWHFVQAKTSESPSRARSQPHVDLREHFRMRK